jgi:hypothetical protein
VDQHGNTQCGVQRGEIRQFPLGSEQVMPRVEAEEFKLPSRVEHQSFIRKLWAWCIVAAVMIFVVIGGIVLALFLKGYDSKKIVEVSTAVFQVLVLSYGMGFFVPAFLTSLFKMHLGIEMSRMSASILEKLDKGVESRLKRVDMLLDSVEKNPKGHPIGKMIDAAVLDIRSEVGKLTGEVKRVADAYTQPIVPPKKPEASGVGTGAKGNGEPAKADSVHHR